MDGSGLTPRLALALIKQLPLGSRTVAILQGGPEFQGWDMNMYMMANLFDAISQNTYVTVAAASGKKKPAKPKPMERPQMKVQRTKGKNSFAAVALQMMNNSKQGK